MNRRAFLSTVAAGAIAAAAAQAATPVILPCPLCKANLWTGGHWSYCQAFRERDTRPAAVARVGLILPVDTKP